MPTRLVHTETFRLAAIYTALFVASMVVLSVLIYFSFDVALHGELMASVDEDIGAIRDGYVTEGQRETVEIIHQHMAANGGTDFFLLEQGGHRLAGNLPVMVSRADVLTLQRSAGIPNKLLGRGEFLAPGLYVFVGRSLSSLNRTERHILGNLAWIFAITLVLAITGGTILSRSFLARMDAITRTCRAIVGGQLHDRIPVRGTSDELDRLATAINEMLDRIEMLMENLRQVSSDIAHDLRTPLTRLRHRLERASEDDGTRGDHGTTLREALAETDTILSLFSALLRIAQIESGTRRSAFSRLNIRDVLQHIAEIYTSVAEDSGHDFRVTFECDAFIQGDRELLTQLFANLIENAIRHTPHGTVIILALRRSIDGALVTVSDSGPGVPAEQRAKLFRRFYRLEQSRTTPGNGLGLALVAAIAELHGAKVVLEDNRPGLVVEICLGPELLLAEDEPNSKVHA